MIKAEAEIRKYFRRATGPRTQTENKINQKDTEKKEAEITEKNHNKATNQYKGWTRTHMTSRAKPYACFLSLSSTFSSFPLSVYKALLRVL
jgi:hypothetical protein